MNLPQWLLKLHDTVLIFKLVILIRNPPVLLHSCHPHTGVSHAHYFSWKSNHMLQGRWVQTFWGNPSFPIEVTRVEYDRKWPFLTIKKRWPWFIKIYLLPINGAWRWITHLNHRFLLVLINMCLFQWAHFCYLLLRITFGLVQLSLEHNFILCPRTMGLIKYQVTPTNMEFIFQLGCE